MTIQLELRSSNRGIIPVHLTIVEGTVQSVVDQAPAEGETKKKKPPRHVVLKTSDGLLQFRLSNASIGLRPGHEIRLVYYKADGFLQKLAGFHNLSKKGSYILNQPKDYFSKWLHVRANEQFQVPLFATPLVLGMAVMVFSLSIGMVLIVLGLIVALLFYKKISKKYVLVSGIHYKSFILQLLESFKQCGPADEGD